MNNSANNQAWIVALHSICLATLIVVCSTFPVAADTITSTRIAGVSYLADLPTMVADQRKLFSQEGLDVQIDYGQSGKDNLKRLRAGEIDFGLMALTPMVIEYLADTSPGSDDDPVILTSLVHSSYLNQVVTLKDNRIQHAAELQSRKVGVMKGTNSEFVWWMFATYHGFNPEAVTIVDTAISDMPEALVSGRIDAAVIWEPWTSRLRSRLADRLQIFSDSNVYTAKWVIVTTRNMVNSQPDLCRKVLSAYSKAIDYIDRYPDASTRLYTKQTGANLAEAVPLGLINFDLVLDWSLVTAWQQQINWARQAGYPADGLDLSFLSVIEPSPLYSLDPDLVSLPINTSSDANRSNKQ